jgi:hypothetical protein
VAWGSIRTYDAGAAVQASRYGAVVHPDIGLIPALPLSNLSSLKFNKGRKARLRPIHIR